MFINLLMAAIYDGFIQNRGIKSHKPIENILENGNEKNDPLEENEQIKNNSPINLIDKEVNKFDSLQKYVSRNIDINSCPMINNILKNQIKIKGEDHNSNSSSPKHGTNFYYPKLTIQYDEKSFPSQIASFLFKLINSRCSNALIFVFLLINVVTLAIDRKNISEQELYRLHLIDFICTIVFLIEIILRLSSLGVKKFVHNYFDQLDLIIILLNIIDILYLVSATNDLFTNYTSFSLVVRCLKILRVFRFISGLKYWQRGSVLFNEMIYALAHTKEFIFLIVIFLIIVSLIGVQLFANRIRFTSNDEIPEKLIEGHAPRVNYDSFGNALMANTLICLNEEWHIFMYQHMRILGNNAAWFFVLVLLLGEILLKRMFMALFINGVISSENTKSLLHQKSKFPQFVKSFFTKSYKDIFEGKNEKNISFWKNEVYNTDKKNFQSKSSYFKTIGENNKNEENFKIRSNKNIIKEFSFSISNKNANLSEQCVKYYRFLCKKIVKHKYFERFIFLTILISVIFLMMNDPFQPSDSTMNRIQFIIDISVLVFYFLEIILKISAFGFKSGEKPFILDPFNLLDLLLFILTFVGTLDLKTHFAGVSFKWCRVFRIFKIIQFHDGLKDAFQILFKSFNDLISLLFFFLMNLFFFGVIAVKFLKGKFLFCDSIDKTFELLVDSPTDCYDYGGDWIKKDLNFDNIFNSLSSLIQISTTEGWLEEMFTGMDVVGNNQNLKEDNKRIMALFYLIFFIVSNLIFINMFIGILVQAYLHQKNLNCNNLFF